MTTDAHKQVIQIVGAVCAYKGEITQDMVLKEIGFDELDRLELIMRLEDQFRIHIDDEQFQGVESINQLTEYLNSLL